MQAYLQPKPSPRSFGSQGKRVCHSKPSKKRIKTPLTDQTCGETHRPNETEGIRIIYSGSGKNIPEYLIRSTPECLFGVFFRQISWKISNKCLKEKVFQEVFSELDLVALPNDIFI